MTRQPSSRVTIDGRTISRSDPVYFIAEIGSNFDGDLNRARALIHLAKDAGADAAKFQHYTADTLVSDTGFRQLDGGGKQSHQARWKKSVFDTYEDASLRKEWTAALKETCDEAGIAFFTSPYAMELIEYVDPYVPAFKVGSGDITWPDIIRHMARRGKPLMIATGASDLEDVKRAMDAALEETPDVILMQCNTNYTGGPENWSYQQLSVLRTFETLYPGVILGLSDHTPGHVAVLGAVALGARVIEKHFTDDTTRPGPDHGFAMTPTSWREMVERTRDLEAALGDGTKRIEDNEKQTVVVQRRCVRAARALTAGTPITKEDFTMLRLCPADAIPPYALASLEGKTLIRDLAAGEHLRREDVA